MFHINEKKTLGVSTKGCWGLSVRSHTFVSHFRITFLGRKRETDQLEKRERRADAKHATKPTRVVYSRTTIK